MARKASHTKCFFFKQVRFFEISIKGKFAFKGPLAIITNNGEDIKMKKEINTSTDEKIQLNTYNVGHIDPPSIYVKSVEILRLERFRKPRNL